ncbi:hypothetical protein CRE_09592 [Caenorhabditis remanei]|uniref:DUF38 domain-containing protein n=1 Tax=Caenorhabditis remanei TaxID=31234 RepID=E3MJ72_CAERE|nr:hypothetical protein CRE_09592 [Caenorhabditis remanei]
MPPGLTYPSLKCVFEFLEANKRIHITSRSSHLKTLDKLVPLHLKMLQIDGYLIMVNNVAYRVLDGNEPEDFFGNDFRRLNFFPMFWRQTRRGYFHIFYQKNGTGNVRYEYENRRGDTFRRRVNKDYHNSYDLIRQLLESLFVGRRAIIVQKLVTGWLQPESENLELKFNVLEIESNGYDLKNFVPLIEPTSFPLKKFTQKLGSFCFFEHPEVRTANHLVITTIYIILFDVINILKSLNCKYIEINDLLFNDNILFDIIQMLLENHRDVETCYMIDIVSVRLVLKNNTSTLMARIKERFNGKYVDFMDADKRSTLTSQYVSIPIDSRTELAVYRNESLKECQEIVIMEVILTGHTPKFFHLDYSKLDESFEKREKSKLEKESREDESLDNDQSHLDKTAAEKYKTHIISLTIMSILIVVLFAWFFFF